MSRFLPSLMALALLACGPTNDRRSDRGRDGKDCVATTCEAEGKNCGAVDDGCGGTLQCGECSGDAVCGGGERANECFDPGSCVAESDATMCARLGRACGPLTGADNCGTQRTVSDCGACTDGGICEGGVCGGACVPESDLSMCQRLGTTCGQVTKFDNCGNSRIIASCGTCDDGLTCTERNTCAGWSTMTSPTTQRLWQVHGSSATNVWAAGWGGTLVRFDGSSWSHVASPSDAHINGLAVIAPDDVWLASQADRKLWHWNGHTWASVANPVPTSHYADMWVEHASSIYAVGLKGVIIHWDGESWTRQGTPWDDTVPALVGDLYEVWGTSSSDIWAVGPDAAVVRWNGSYWYREADQLIYDYVSIWGTSSFNMIMLGDSGPGIDNVPYRYDGSVYQQIDVAQPDPKDLFGTHGHDVWAVGDLGHISHWDGESWTAVSSPTERKLESVWAASEDTAFAVGEGGTILRYQR